MIGRSIVAPFSTTRLFAFIIALALLAAVSFARSSKRLSRAQTAILGFVFGGLAVASIYPDMLLRIARGMGLGMFPGYRILLLAVMGLILVYVLVFFLFMDLNAERHAIVHIAETFFQKDMLALAGLCNKDIPDVLVIIPALNEAENLKLLLPRIPTKLLGHHIRPLVISDGSVDDTAIVARELGALVLEKQIRRGGGAALRSGYFVGQLLGARYLVTMDADGQHLPEEIDILLKPLLSGNSDFVSGSRILGKENEGDIMRRIGTRVFSTVLSILLRRRITDPSNGYRAFKTDMIMNIHLREQQFHTSELVIEAVSRGYRFMEVPVRIQPRQEGKTKKPKSSLIYGFCFFRTILRTWLRR